MGGLEVPAVQRFRIFLSVLLAALVACAAADARERKKKKDEDAQKSEEKTATEEKTTTTEPAEKTEPAKPVPIDEAEPKEDKTEKPKKQPKASGGGLSTPVPAGWEDIGGAGEMELRNRKIEAHVVARLLPSKGAESPREWLRDYLGQVRKKKRGGSVVGDMEAKKAGERRFVFATLGAGEGDDRLRQRIYVAESGTPGQYLVLVATAPPGKMASARKDFDEIIDSLEER